MNEVYLDYMATTPIDPAAIEKMQQAMGVESSFANPSSQHPAGLAAAALVEEARGRVAKAIGADPEAVFWTSGATESNNLAIRGAANFYARQGKHIVTMQSEHKAVSEIMVALEKEGFEITTLAPKANGLIDLKELEFACRADTRLISVMWVNNETGVIQPVREIAAMAKKRGILVHVDAAQALGKVDINLRDIPIDLLSLAAHKYYGPKGVGALFIRQKPLVRLQPVLAGSGQEGGVRPGTVPTHQVVGMGAACKFVVNREEECKRIQVLKDRLLAGLKKLPGVGFYIDHDQVVPHCIALFIQDINMAALLGRLIDLMISTGSACNSATPEPSPVLLSMGVNPEQADNSCRISLGRNTTRQEIDYVIERFNEELRYLRGITPELDDPLVEVAGSFQNAYPMLDATHTAAWKSETERAEFVLFARIEKEKLEQLSFLLNGRPVWFAALESFCSQFAGSSLNQLKCLTTEMLMPKLNLDATQMHVAHAVLTSAQQWIADEKNSTDK